jgi:biopolymer transport protein ExbB
MFARLIKKLAVVAAFVGAAAFSPVSETVNLSVPIVATAQAQAAGEKKAEGPKTVETSLWDKIKLINPIVTFLLFTGSIVMVWFGIDGFIKTMNGRMAPPVQLEQIKQFFRSGDYRGAFNFSKASPSPLNDLVRGGTSFLPEGKNHSEEAMLNEIARLNAGYMGRINYLSVIAVCSPMVGLCGTVFGMMNAFEDLSSSGGGVEALSKSIGEVLVSTALGLIIAIPAFFLFYFLRNRVAVGLQTVHNTVGALFRGIQYDAFVGRVVGDEEIFAQLPQWPEGELLTDDQQGALENQPVA